MLNINNFNYTLLSIWVFSVTSNLDYNSIREDEYKKCSGEFNFVLYSKGIVLSYNIKKNEDESLLSRFISLFSYKDNKYKEGIIGGGCLLAGKINITIDKYPPKLISSTYSVRLSNNEYPNHEETDSHTKIVLSYKHIYETGPFTVDSFIGVVEQSCPSYCDFYLV